MTKASITEWKQVVGYEGFYEVSNTGKVRSVDRPVKGKSNCTYIRKGKAMISHVDKCGYPRVGLRRGSGRIFFFVHTLVATAFIGKRPDDCNQINHKNSVKTHNVPNNLEWCDGKHNQRHSMKNGTHTLSLHRDTETGRNTPSYVYAPGSI